LALFGDAGVRVKNKSKHLVCERTAKTYLYWDNLMYHFKNLAPLYGKRVDFKVGEERRGSDETKIIGFF
jgi:hypothetical protein